MWWWRNGGNGRRWRGEGGGTTAAGELEGNPDDAAVEKKGTEVAPP